MHIGTTQVAINRASANLALTGITSIDGNAATATKLATAVNINGVSFDGSTNITITAADATKLPLAGGTMTGAISFAAGQTWPTFNQSTTGNAATATKLATARTLTLGNTGKTFDGSADVSWSLSDIGAQAVLTSGTNIKTINNQSLLGSGDITISSQGTISVTSNTGLSFSNNTLGTIYNTTMPDTMQSTTAGGATPTPASTWKTRTIVQVLDAILFPTNPPTISTQKSVTLNVSGDSGILEIGTIHNRTLSHVFERGIITNGDGTQGPPLVGAATSSAVYAGGPGITGSTTNGALGNLAVLPGTNNWTVTITHAVGTGNYFDNKGNIDTSLNSFRAAGTVSDVTSSPTITGIYPYYWGVSSTQPTTTTIAAAISGGSANRVLADSNGTVSITFGAAAQFIWFAHAEIYTVKTKWYNTDLNQGNIGAGNFILSPLDQAVSANNGSWTNVNYKVYISGGATNTSGAIQFRTA
jgi:hypothetical protein